MHTHAAPLRIVLVDDDDQLVADIGAFSHDGVRFTVVAPGGVIDAGRLADQQDVVVVSIDTPEGFDLLEQLGERRQGAPVVALAAYGVADRTLENTLTIAELRGAAFAMPKPVDAVELVLACLDVAARRKPTAEMRATAAELEGRRPY